MSIMDPSTSKISLAYLGPEGTYGHQAAQVFLPALSEDVDVELIPCPTISDVYHHPSDYLVLPVQNTLAGSVTETADCLLSPLASGRENGKVEVGGIKGGNPGPSRPRIIGSTDLEIAHCLVVRRGVNMDDIKWVRSHEQALTQSTIFLHTHLPFATLHPWRSTASAALSLLQLSPEDPPGDGAALCSKAVLTLYPQLELLYEGTQAGNDNFTRFLLLSRHPDRPSICPIPTSNFFACRDSMTLSTLAQNSKLKAVHARPAPVEESSERYPTWYLVEVDSSTIYSSLDRKREDTVKLGTC